MFCGRNDFFKAYYAFFGPDPRRVLAIVADEQPGVGRPGCCSNWPRRCCGTAISRSSWRPTSRTGSHRSRCRRSARRCRTVRKVRRTLELLGAGKPASGDARRPFRAGPGPPGAPRCIAAESTPGELMAAPRDWRAGRSARAGQGRRRQHESVERAEGRAIILLDRMEQYGELLSEVMFGMLDGFGFGTSDEPVPAVLALAMGQPANTIVKDTLERFAPRSWSLRCPRALRLQCRRRPAGLQLDPAEPAVERFTDRHVLNDQADRGRDMARTFMLTTFKGLPGRSPTRPNSGASPSPS